MTKGLKKLASPSNVTMQPYVLLIDLLIFFLQIPTIFTNKQIVENYANSVK